MEPHGAPPGDARDLRRWLEARDPEPPEAIRGWLQPPPGDPPTGASVDGVLHLALQALEGALSGDGERGGAYRLLGADGLLTYACEAALESDDPEAALRAILARVCGARTDP